MTLTVISPPERGVSYTCFQDTRNWFAGCRILVSRIQNLNPKPQTPESGVPCTCFQETGYLFPGCRILVARIQDLNLRPSILNQGVALPVVHFGRSTCHAKRGPLSHSVRTQGVALPPFDASGVWRQVCPALSKLMCFNFKVSGNEVHYTILRILLIKIVLCSKLRCKIFLIERHFI